MADRYSGMCRERDEDLTGKVDFNQLFSSQAHSLSDAVNEWAKTTKLAPGTRVQL